MKRIGGNRRKTRYKLQKPLRQRGKLSLSKYFQTFDVGDKVNLIAEPAVQKGMYLPRYHNKSGIIQKKTGTCYEVKINDLGLDKVLIIHPVHLRKAKA
ncbi:50S ribosomal protein L21e [Candidatus Woesearchaeota archaeon]|nr:50S ribosomal protein L21e [Candidatus Woesearchaeota archaeon]